MIFYIFHKVYIKNRIGSIRLKRYKVKKKHKKSYHNKEVKNNNDYKRGDMINTNDFDKLLRIGESVYEYNKKNNNN